MLPEQDIANFWKGQPWSLAEAAFSGGEVALLKRRSLIEESTSFYRHDLLENEKGTSVYMHDLLERVGKQKAEQKESWMENQSPDVSPAELLVIFLLLSRSIHDGSQMTRAPRFQFERICLTAECCEAPTARTPAQWRSFRHLQKGPRKPPGPPDHKFFWSAELEVVWEATLLSVGVRHTCKGRLISYQSPRYCSCLGTLSLCRSVLILELLLKRSV